MPHLPGDWDFTKTELLRAYFPGWQGFIVFNKFFFYLQPVVQVGALSDDFF